MDNFQTKTLKKDKKRVFRLEIYFKTAKGEVHNFIFLCVQTMNKTQLIEELASKLGISKKLAGDFINTFVSTVVAGVKKEGEVRIQGFGTFKKSHRKAREGVNPQNPSQKIKIPAMNVVTFKAGSDFKGAVK